MKSAIILVATIVLWSGSAFCQQEDEAAGQPVAVLSPSPMNFGFVTQTHNKTLTLTVTNTGSADLVIRGGKIVYGSPNFEISTDGCAGVTVPPGGECQVQLVFSPSDFWAKPMVGYFAIFDNADNGYQYIQMYGWDNPQIK